MAATSPSLLRRLVRHLDALAQDGDLAAVLIHLNDTYLIEPRPPEIPGLARIARLIKFLKRHVRARVGEDVVLALHAGDMLSPSYLSNTVQLHGRQMVEALNECGLDFATLGNHEFDFGESALLDRAATGNVPGRSRIPWPMRWRISKGATQKEATHPRVRAAIGTTCDPSPRRDPGHADSIAPFVSNHERLTAQGGGDRLVNRRAVPGRRSAETPVSEADDAAVPGVSNAHAVPVAAFLRLHGALR